MPALSNYHDIAVAPHALRLRPKAAGIQSCADGYGRRTGSAVAPQSLDRIHAVLAPVLLALVITSVEKTPASH